MNLKQLYLTAFTYLNVSTKRAECNTCGNRVLGRASTMKMHLIKFHLSLAMELKIQPTLKKLRCLIPITMPSSAEDEQEMSDDGMYPKAIKYFEMPSSDEEGEREMIEVRSQPASPDSPKITKCMSMTSSEDHETIEVSNQPASPIYSNYFELSSSDDEIDMFMRRSQPASPNSEDHETIEVSSQPDHRYIAIISNCHQVMMKQIHQDLANQEDL